MSDEIKEINIPENVLVALGDLTNGALNYYKATETIKVKYSTILNHITNLHQENKKLLKKSYSDDVRITKAIECINKLSNEPNVFGHYGIDGNCKKYLLNILQGDE